jgi:chorismate mutase-like protein
MSLAEYRKRLDELDDAIVRLLGERLDVCREVAVHKRASAIPMMQPERVAEVRAAYLRRGADAGLPDDFTRRFFDLLIATTCRLEDEIIDDAPAAPVRSPT